MNNKASSQVWWIIIAAVIALLVVFIMTSIFTGRVGPAKSSFMDCASKGGYCETKTPDKSCSEVCRLKGETHSQLFTCSDDDTANGNTDERCCCLSTKKGEGESCTADRDCREGLKCDGDADNKRCAPPSSSSPS